MRLIISSGINSRLNSILYEFGRSKEDNLLDSFDFYVILYMSRVQTEISRSHNTTRGKVCNGASRQRRRAYN
jgi:hypothetical protein